MIAINLELLHLGFPADAHFSKSKQIQLKHYTNRFLQEVNNVLVLEVMHLLVFSGTDVKLT